MVLRCLALLAFLSLTSALPPFSWEKLPLYVHCANQTGPLSPAFRARAAKTTFVTLEKWHCLDCAPKNHGAEGKMEAEGKRLKALNPKLEVVMYFAADLARTWYDVGVWFDEHPELELSCGGKPVIEQGFHAFDYAQPAAVDRWVQTYTDAVATGCIDGAFVDGLATDAGWRSRWLKGCNASHQTAFLKGVAAAQQQLGQKLGPDRLIFANMGPMRPGDNAQMIEFFLPGVPLLYSILRRPI
jgi:hypothetical protein